MKTEEEIKAELRIKPGSPEDLQWKFHISPTFLRELAEGLHNN